MKGISIKGRIYARKILLTYFYEQYFLENAGKKGILFTDIEKIGKSIYEVDGKEVVLSKIINASYYKNIDDEVRYITNHHFSNIPVEDIDRSYIKIIGPLFWKYENTVRGAVNKHAVSFNYNAMDLIDRVLFVLGYIELLILKTPKKVVLNEMVELAKRYGDDKSSKLLNGIGHKILTEIEN